MPQALCTQNSHICTWFRAKLTSNPSQEARPPAVRNCERVKTEFSKAKQEKNAISCLLSWDSIHKFQMPIEL